jgi:hypothetical protein
MSDQWRGFERCPAAGQRPDNQEALVRLKVEAHPDCQFGVDAKPAFQIHSHASLPTTLRRIEVFVWLLGTRRCVRSREKPPR